MNLSPYLKIKRIEFIVTYQCTGRCIHCSMGKSIGTNPDGFSHVDGDKAAEAIKWLAENYDVTSVMTFGGEPLMYAADVYKIHKAAAGAGIPARQLITNGYFSNNGESIARTAAELADAGVTETLISVDAFHQQRIPIEPVKEFAESLKKTGVKMRISPAWLVNRGYDNEFNAMTEELIAQFDVPVGSGNDIFMAGNAIENLAQHYPAPCLDHSDKCGSMPYTAPLTDVDSISITPNGDVEACSFVIGNIYREHISDIVARYDPYANEAMCAVMDGVPAMLEYARKNGIGADVSKCYSICDVCRMINRK